MTFDQLGLCPPILSALYDLGYVKPSPIQEKAIPPALAGRDVLGCAQTGTGKTCAFAAPILQRLKEHPVQGRPIRSLILTPTRELALQIQESFEQYGKNLPLRSAVIFGGVGQQPQVDKLKAGVDILVATPGRLQDLYDQGFIHVERLEIFVLDEADRMLDMGFIHDVRKILKWLPAKKQTLFFSATMPPEVRGLVDALLTDPVKVAVDPVSSPVEVIDQKLCYVDRGNKSKLLAHLIKTVGVKNALIFTRTKHGANKVAGDLEKAGIHAAAIHGNKSQTARQQALADFKAGRVKALVATDIAARGIDIEELSHVFNYNLPDVPETYVHRIGRTGRAGHGGTAISFCEFGEKELLGPIEKLLKKPIPVMEGHPFPMENFEAPKRDKHGKIVNADDQEARQAARERKKQRDQAKAQNAAGKPEKSAAPAARQERAPGRGQAGAAPAARSAPERQQRQKPARPAAPQGGAAPKGRTGGTAQFSPVTDAEREAAFRAWLEEERAIQAQRFRDDPPEEVMDATARLLAPKKPAAQSAPGGRQEPPRSGRERAHGRQQTSGTPAQQAQSAAPRRKQKPTQSPAKGEAPASRRKPSRSERREEPPRQKEKAFRSDRRRGPAAPTLRSGGQKDSTEQQGSLMRPYYFNPNED